MLRPRPILAGLAILAAVAVGSSVAAFTTHRPTSATAGTVATTQLPDTTAVPPTTAPPPGPKTQGPIRPIPHGSTTSPRISAPALAAGQVFQAWQAGDRRHALQAATPNAVRTLFAFAPTQRLRFTGCRYSGLGYNCFYTSTDVGLWYVAMRVEGGASAGYRVVSVNAQMRFGDPDTAARYVLKAWLEGDRAKARRAASETVVDALWSRLGERASGPRFDGCTFRDVDRGSDCAIGATTVGLGFTMQVKGGADLGWQAVAIRFAQL
jgi:hypothetical protein